MKFAGTFANGFVLENEPIFLGGVKGEQRGKSENWIFGGWSTMPIKESWRRPGGPFGLTQGRRRPSRQWVYER